MPFYIRRKPFDEKFNSSWFDDAVLVCFHHWAPTELTFWIEPELANLVAIVHCVLIVLVGHKDGVTISKQIIEGTLLALWFALGAVVFGCSIARFAICS